MQVIQPGVRGLLRKTAVSCAGEVLKQRQEFAEMEPIAKDFLLDKCFVILEIAALTLVRIIATFLFQCFRFCLR